MAKMIFEMKYQDKPRYTQMKLELESIITNMSQVNDLSFDWMKNNQQLKMARSSPEKPKKLQQIKIDFQSDDFVQK